MKNPNNRALYSTLIKQPSTRINPRPKAWGLLQVIKSTYSLDIKPDSGARPAKDAQVINILLSIAVVAVGVLRPSWEDIDR
jgi:hypothetical protein